jgi:glutaredoxin
MLSELQSMALKSYERSRSVVLYTRAGCHLCEEAEQMLAEHGLRPTIVDIDASLALRERFDTCVPVVEIDGKIRFRGRVNAVLLRRILGD